MALRCCVIVCRVDVGKEYKSNFVNWQFKILKRRQRRVGELEVLTVKA